MTTIETRRIDRLAQSIAPFQAFFDGPFAKLNANPDIANFAVGNPQEMPLPAYVEALRANLEPRRRDWFAYKFSESKARIAVAQSLSARTGMTWDPADVAMTNGGFAALAVSMRALVEPGDEVIFLSPPWFFYEFMILAADGVPIRLRLAPPAFEPDLDEIAAAITPRTRAIIFNSPHNPSGRVYPPETLEALAQTLTDAPSGSVIRSSSFPMSRTTGSCSTGASSIRHPSTTRTRSSPTRTGRPSWRRDSASAI